MNVGGTRLDAERDDFLDQANHAAGLRIVFVAVTDDTFAHDAVDGFLDGTALRVMPFDSVNQIRFRRSRDIEAQTGGAFQRIDGHHVERVAQHHRQGIALTTHR